MGLYNVEISVGSLMLPESWWIAGLLPTHPTKEKGLADDLGAKASEAPIEAIRHYADMRITLDVEDGVKVNYVKFGDLLAEVKAVTGGTSDD
jgi:hypothetical protein